MFARFTRKMQAGSKYVSWLKIRELDRYWIYLLNHAITLLRRAVRALQVLPPPILS